MIIYHPFLADRPRFTLSLEDELSTRPDVGKKTTRKKGHILIDSVLAGRPPKDGDPDE